MFVFITESTYKQSYEAFLLDPANSIMADECKLIESLNEEHYNNSHARNNEDKSEEQINMEEHPCAEGHCEVSRHIDSELASLIDKELEFDEGDGSREELLCLNVSNLSPELVGASLFTSSKVPPYVLPTVNLPVYNNIASYLSQPIDPRTAVREHFDGTSIFLASSMSNEMKVRNVTTLYQW